jgi:hypothetical protein
MDNADIVRALNRIADSVMAVAANFASSTHADWTRYSPLIAAFVAAVTAIAATRASVWFSSRRLELNCARALLVEIRGINTEVATALVREKERTFVRLPFLAVSDRVCPVYRGASIPAYGP